MGRVTSQRRVLLRGGWGFDGDEFRGQQDVLLWGEYVRAVGPEAATFDGAEVIDCSGTTVMPGLIDAHVHLSWAGVEPPPADVESSVMRAERNAMLLLQAGVTTV